MKIINKIPIDEENFAFFDQMDSYYSNSLGFFQLTKLTSPIDEPKKKFFYKTVSDTIEKLNLDFNKKYKDLYNFRYYINQFNMFSSHRIVSINDYNSEILSTVYSYYPEMFFEHLDNGLSTENVSLYLDVIKQETFKNFFYNKLVENNNIQVFKEILKNKCEGNISYLGNKNLSYSFEKNIQFFNLLNNIGEIYSEGYKKIDSGEKYYSSELFFQMSEKQQKDWLEKYNNQIKIYNLNIFSETYNINKKLGFNLFTPETDTIKYLGDKYKSILETIMSDEKYCRLFKTAIYGALYIFKNKNENFEPIKHLNQMLGVDSSWAVGTEKIKDPSFYGDSEFGKFFYGYAPYMTGDKNPYKDIINNKTLNKMDEEAIKIHRYFRNNGISEYLHELIFEKEIIGNKSLYDALHSVRDLIQIIESPILVGSLTNMAISVFKGIISSIINSAISAVDFSLSYTMKQLFYIEFIPIGDKKHSLKDLYNYAVFLKLILTNYEDLGAVKMIDKEDFVRKAYTVVGVSEKKMEQLGYFAYSRNLNANEITYFNYEEQLVKKDKLVVTCDQDFKVFYTILQFAKQKYLLEYGRVFEGNMSNSVTIHNLINRLTDSEIFFCMDLYEIDFYKINDKFDKFSLEEYYSFNDNLMDIQHFYDLSDHSTSVYKTYQETDKIKLQIKMDQNLFESTNYKKIIYRFVNHYLDVVKKNKENIEKDMFDKNGISDVDDFLMRFLPSICELAKTLGFNDIGISTIIKIIDYFCNFITDILFRDYFFKIKSAINDQLKMFSENMFKTLDKFKTDEVIVKFDIGGSILVKKIDSILKLLEDGVTFSTVLNECFKDDGYIYDSSEELEEYPNDFEYDDFEYEYDDNQDIVIEKVEREEEQNEVIIKPGEPTDDKVVDDIIIEKVKNPIIIVDKELNVVIKKPEYEKDETKDVIIDEVIKIKEKLESIKNKEVNKLINEIIQLENEIQKELVKIKPNYPLLKDKKKEVALKNEELSKIKYKVTTPYDNDREDDREDVIISDFINDELNFDRVNNLLDELSKVVYENDLYLTNHEIIRLLK